MARAVNATAASVAAALLGIGCSQGASGDTQIAARTADVGTSQLATIAMEVSDDSCFKTRQMPYALSVHGPVDAALGRLPMRNIAPRQWVSLSTPAFSANGEDMSWRTSAGPNSGWQVMAFMIGSLPATYEAELSETGIVTVHETGMSANVPGTFTGAFLREGTLSWNATETVDLNTGEDHYVFHAALDGKYRRQDRLFECHYHGTLDARAIGKRHVVIPQPAPGPQPLDCSSHFRINPDIKPKALDNLIVDVQGDLLHITAGSAETGRSPDGKEITHVNALNLNNPIQPSDDATAQDRIVYIQNMTQWTGTATYGTEDGAPVWFVPDVPIAPFRPPPWLDIAPYYLQPPFFAPYFSGLGTITDTPDLKIPLHYNGHPLTRITFTKHFVMFMGCTDPDVDRALYPMLDDQKHWIHPIATVTWQVDFNGNVEIDKSGNARFEKDTNAGVHLLFSDGYLPYSGQKIVVTDPAANCAQYFDSLQSLNTGPGHSPAKGVLGAGVSDADARESCMHPSPIRQFFYGLPSVSPSPPLPANPIIPSSAPIASAFVKATG